MTRAFTESYRDGMRAAVNLTRAQANAYAAALPVAQGDAFLAGFSCRDPQAQRRRGIPRDGKLRPGRRSWRPALSHGPRPMTLNVNERAWNLYRQIQAQRATLKSYADTLAFVRVRQENPQHVEPVAKALWEIAERMRGDMDPNWSQRQ